MTIDISNPMWLLAIVILAIVFVWVVRNIEDTFWRNALFLVIAVALLIAIFALLGIL